MSLFDTWRERFYALVCRSRVGVDRFVAPHKGHLLTVTPFLAPYGSMDHLQGFGVETFADV